MTLLASSSTRFWRSLLSAAIALLALQVVHAQQPQAEQVSEFRPLPSMVDAPLLDVEDEAPTAPPAPRGPAPVYYDGAQASSDDARFAAMEKKIKELEKQVKANAPKKVAPGEWEDLSQDKWNVRMGGHIQMDYINWADATPTIVGDQNYFEFRRLRLTADGTGYGVYDFRFQMTLEPETVGTNPPGVTTSPDVKDAYFSINELPWLGRLRVGNFFVPFGLEQVTNDTNNVFLERSIPTQNVFTAEREVGLCSYNCTDDQSISWASGIFFDSISEALKERLDDNQGCRVSGRLNWVPYYDEPSNGRYAIHTGVGILYTDDQDDRLRVSTRPQIHEGPRLMDTGNLAGSSFTNANLEFAIVNGPITLQSEAYVSRLNLANNDSATLNGAYAHVSWFLTGENRIYERFGQHGAQFGRNQPYSNVFAVDGFRSLGAWEAKIRTSYLDLNQVGAGQYQDITVGFNWYWSDRVRLMFDWIHPWTTADAVFGTTTSDILGTRVDWNW